VIEANRRSNVKRASIERTRALKMEEILAVVETYRRCVIRAMCAGFDGVKGHGANGYLVYQFLQL
jgi:N-ethylmaleimide reductase